MLSNKFNVHNIASLSNIVTLIITCFFTIQLSYKLGFYTAYGQGWLLSLFSPIDILFSNFYLVIMYIFSFIYIEKIVDEKEKDKDITKTIKSGLMMIIISYALALYQGLIEWHIVIVFCAIFICVTFMIKHEKITTKLIALGVLIIGIPLAYGNFDGTQSSTKNFPKVKLKNETTDWRLLDNYADKIIVIENNNSEEKKIKILKVETAISIEH